MTKRERFEYIIESIQFIEKLAMDYQFNPDDPEYLGFINTTLSEHDISLMVMDLLLNKTKVINKMILCTGFKISKASVDEFILSEI